MIRSRCTQGSVCIHRPSSKGEVSPPSPGGSSQLSPHSCGILGYLSSGSGFFHYWCLQGSLLLGQVSICPSERSDPTASGPLHVVGMHFLAQRTMVVQGAKEPPQTCQHTWPCGFFLTLKYSLPGAGTSSEMPDVISRWDLIRPSLFPPQHELSLGQWSWPPGSESKPWNMGLLESRMTLSHTCLCPCKIGGRGSGVLCHLGL